MSKAKRLIAPVFAVMCVAGGLVAPLAGCGGGGSRDEPSTPKVGDPVTLRVGKSEVVDADVSGDPVRFVITEVRDSRCPEGGTCGAPSVVNVAATLSGAGVEAQSISTDKPAALDFSASGNRPAYHVSITDVKPPRLFGSGPIAQSEYRITVKVERVP